MANSKWVPKLTMTTSMRAAARMVLAARAHAVQRYLERVATHPRNDPEDVHQLRVAARRMTSALSIFKQCLDPRSRHKLRRATRRIRQRAGRVRDLDVLELLLEQRLKELDPSSTSVAERCRKAVRQWENSARYELARVLRKWSDRFQRAAADSLAGLKRKPAADSRHAQSVRDTATFLLGKRLNELEAACHENLDDLDNLHRLRIAAKRLRYAMEVFANCFPVESFRDLYAQVEQIQTELGEINDQRNLCKLLAQIRFATAGGKQGRENKDAKLLCQIASAVSRELARLHVGFLCRWTSRQQAGFYRRFKKLLHTSKSAGEGIRLPQPF